jgi:hypothetical protein
MGAQDPIIRASELAEYAFCARAWWLGRVKGLPSANVVAMRHGAEQHQAHGRAVEGYHRLRSLAVVLLILAVVALAAWLLLGLGR